MANIKTMTITGAVLDADAIALSQTPTSSITLNGTLVSGGIATLTPTGRVSITSAGDISNRTLTFTGTDRNDRAQSETITGPNATTVYTLKDFKTVTVATISGLAAAAITIGTNGVASTAWYVGDYRTGKVPIITIDLSSGAVLTYTVEYTTTNLNDMTLSGIDAQISAAQSAAAFPSTDSAVVAASSDQATNYINGMPGMRVTLNTYTSGTLTMKIVSPSNSVC